MILPQPPHQPADAPVAAGVALFGHQVLVDAPGMQALIQLLKNDLSPGRSGRDGALGTARAGGRAGRF